MDRIHVTLGCWVTRQSSIYRIKDLRSDMMFDQQFVGGVPSDFSDFKDEEIDKWYDQQARTMDLAKREQIVRDMQRRMFELVPASILHWYVYQLGRWAEVRDYMPGIGAYNNLQFQNVWLAN